MHGTAGSYFTQCLESRSVQLEQQNIDCSAAEQLTSSIGSSTCIFVMVFVQQLLTAAVTAECASRASVLVHGLSMASRAQHGTIKDRCTVLSPN
jgi:hypothetical protein